MAGRPRLHKRNDDRVPQVDTAGAIEYYADGGEVSNLPEGPNTEASVDLGGIQGQPQPEFRVKVRSGRGKEQQPKLLTMADVKAMRAVAIKRKVTEREIVLWAFEHMDVVDVQPLDAPTAGAWALLNTMRLDVGLRVEFYRMWSRLLPTKAALEAENKFEDDGRQALAVIDRVRAAYDRSHAVNNVPRPYVHPNPLAGDVEYQLQQLQQIQQMPQPSPTVPEPSPELANGKAPIDSLEGFLVSKLKHPKKSMDEDYF